MLDKTPKNINNYLVDKVGLNLRQNYFSKIPIIQNKTPLGGTVKSKIESLNSTLLIT